MQSCWICSGYWSRSAEAFNFFLHRKEQSFFYRAADLKGCPFDGAVKTDEGETNMKNKKSEKEYERTEMQEVFRGERTINHERLCEKSGNDALSLLFSRDDSAGDGAPAQDCADMAKEQLLSLVQHGDFRAVKLFYDLWERYRKEKQAEKETNDSNRYAQLAAIRRAVFGDAAMLADHRRAVAAEAEGLLSAADWEDGFGDDAGDAAWDDAAGGEDGDG